MNKYKWIYFFIYISLIIPAAYCQEKKEYHLIKSIAGTVINVDNIGNIITIRTENQQQMSFSVVDNASITQETRNIGLMDIEQADPVIMQYYVLSTGKLTAVNIMDNKAIASQ